MSELLDLAQRVVRQAQALGAQEVVASVGKSISTTITRRDGKVEQATESTSRGLSFSVLVDNRFSSHGTSDLRPDAISEFIKQAIAATRILEQDPERALPEAPLCGRGATAAALDVLDSAYNARSAEARATDAELLEQTAEKANIPSVISRSSQVADGCSQTARVDSNGFSDTHEDAWFMWGAEATFQEGGKRPEVSSYFGARYLTDLPEPQKIAQQLEDRARERAGSKPIDSGSYPLILLNRATGKLLGAFGGPLAGSALHEQRSCLAGKLGSRVGSAKFTLLDDPTIPRGLASRPWDGEGLIARPFPVVSEGVLDSYYINVYYGRKLGMKPTTGGRSNWVIPPGDQSWEAIAKAYPKAILVDGFLGGNSNATSGDFSFGIRGALIEHGVRTQAISEMNVSGNLTDIFEKLVEIANDPYRYSSVVSPTLVFEDVRFSGT